MSVSRPGEQTRGRPKGARARITVGAVQLFRKYTGRGPTDTRTHLMDDLLIVILRDTLTDADREMVAAGHDADVLKMRSANQEAMREELVALVEAEIGRRVVGFSSHNSIEPDMAVELFMLEGSER